MLERNTIAAIASEVVGFRRWLHEHAELSFQEYETADFIETQLQIFGYRDIFRPTPTSVVARLCFDRPGPVIALRADIDALPIQESNGLSFASKRPGVMHACGHDGHAAILLGVAHYMKEQTSSLGGEVRFIFQHAEETPPGGAVQLIQANVLEGVEEVYGLHITSVLQTGQFGICRGPLTSATDGFKVVIQGKGGHSSMPQECIDPIVIAAHVVLGLQSVPSRMVCPDEPFVLSACKVSAGSAYNIIPDTAEIEGSVRSFSHEARELAESAIGRIAREMASAYGASVEYVYNKGYDSVYNEPALADQAARVISEEFSPEAIVEMKPIMPGDDFGYYSQKCPGFFLQLGAANAEKGISAPHHNPNYLMDEEALELGLRYFCVLLIEKLESI